MKWWKFIFDTKTPTWQAYGRLVFVQADTEDAARARAIEAAQAEFPQSEIVPFALGESTPEAAAAFAERRARWQHWMDNSRTGVANRRGDL